MKNQKSLTNKGFSLVELIIVVAIMAVLIGVLAPQYLRYVEKSRLQRDNSSISEIANVAKMTSADETIIAELSTAVTIKFTSSTGEIDLSAMSSTSAFYKELDNTLNLSEIKLTSSTYSKNGYPELTVKVNSKNQVEVSASGWWENPTTKATTDKVF